MVYVQEFEFYDSGGCVIASPCGGLDGGTFGDDLADAVESAADWLSVMVDDYLVGGTELPEWSLGNEPTHGGRVIAVAVDRNLCDIPSMTASEAAKALGVSSARVAQLINSGLLESWKDGSRRLVSKASVEARLESSPKAGRPKSRATA